MKVIKELKEKNKKGSKTDNDLSIQSKGFGTYFENTGGKGSRLRLPLPPSIMAASGSDQYSQLSAFTAIVCDSGDLDSIKKFVPQDATTNPSLLFQACSDPKYDVYVQDAIAYGKKNGGANEADQLELAIDRLFINVGTEITKIVPGVVSTEVDSKLSFDVQAMVAKAKKFIKLYKEKGVDQSRVLIKLPSTWEGIRACEILEKEGIHVNMTLLFSMSQAVACANSGATLISPFVGRIMDWWAKSEGKKSYEPEEDPGVKSVRAIYKYYKSIGCPTIVMGASFRNIGEIQALAGCDKLTISPKLLEELKANKEPLPRKLTADGVQPDPSKARVLTESQFRWELNEDAMATEKLAEGVRNFGIDAAKLEKIIKAKFDAHKA
jgi:transaldolase